MKKIWKKKKKNIKSQEADPKIKKILEVFQKMKIKIKKENIEIIKYNDVCFDNF